MPVKPPQFDVVIRGYWFDENRDDLLPERFRTAD